MTCILAGGYAASVGTRLMSICSSSAPCVKRFKGLSIEMASRPNKVQNTAIPVNISSSPQVCESSHKVPASLFPNPVAAQ